MQQHLQIFYVSCFLYTNPTVEVQEEIFLPALTAYKLF